jgi:TIR domain
MAIFISYARHDRPAVEVLARDLERTRESVWMDNELTGGQAWWDTILSQIRACDLYVLALSPESLRSRACRLELQYALAVRRPLLPVQIGDVAISTAPQAVADTQIVDYRQRTPEAGFALAAAVGHRPPAPPLPEPLPAEPAPPMSYMHEFSEQVDATVLSYRDQNHLLADLRGYLSEDDDRETALQLIRALRGRHDIGMNVAQEIDQILAHEQGRATSSPPPAQVPPTQGHASSPPHYQQQAPVSGYPRTQPTPGPQPPTSPYQPPPRSQPTPPAYQAPPQSQPTPPAYQPPSAASYQPAQPTTAYPPPSSRYQPLQGPQQPSGYRPARPHPQGVVILVLAILGLFYGVTAVVALVMASRATKDIKADPQAYTNRSTITAARVVAWILVAFWLVVLLYAFLVAATY